MRHDPASAAIIIMLKSLKTYGMAQAAGELMEQGSPAFETTDDLYAFLTTTANAEVGMIHDKAMPVILTTEAERDLWMTGSWREVQALQRPLPEGSLSVVATGRRKDGPNLDALNSPAEGPAARGSLL